MFLTAHSRLFSAPLLAAKALAEHAPSGLLALYAVQCLIRKEATGRRTGREIEFDKFGGRLTSEIHVGLVFKQHRLPGHWSMPFARFHVVSRIPGVRLVGAILGGPGGHGLAAVVL